MPLSTAPILGAVASAPVGSQKPAIDADVALPTRPRVSPGAAMTTLARSQDPFILGAPGSIASTRAGMISTPASSTWVR